MAYIPLQTCVQCATVITAGYIMDVQGVYHPWCHTQRPPFVCGYRWKPRVPYPDKCPKCGDAWDKPMKRGKYEVRKGR